MKITWPKIAVVVVAIVAAGLLFRYGSMKPCDWLLHDMTAKSGMPQLVIRGLLAVQFEGREPGTGRCFTRWIDLHVNGLEPQLKAR